MLVFCCEVVCNLCKSVYKNGIFTLGVKLFFLKDQIVNILRLYRPVWSLF